MDGKFHSVKKVISAWDGGRNPHLKPSRPTQKLRPLDTRGLGSLGHFSGHDLQDLQGTLIGSACVSVCYLCHLILAKKGVLTYILF